jgi:flagellar assembly protein FliH
MSSRLVSRETNAAFQPMPWHDVSTPVPPSRQSVQYNTPVESNPVEEALTRQFEARFAALEAQAERRAQEAREAGRREGEAVGRNAARAELQPEFDRLAGAVRSASELRATLRAHAEADLVKLAIAIARRIVNRELSADPDAIAGLVRIALEKVRLQEVIRVRTHPDHLDAIRRAFSATGAVQVELAGDPVLERGGVQFETSRGLLDVSTETQFREIERGLTDRLATAL